MKKKHNKSRFLIVIIAIIIATAVILVTRSYMEKEVIKQQYGNLRDVAVQNEVTIENLIDEKQTMLAELAQEIQKHFPEIAEGDMTDAVEWLKHYSGIFNAKRLGIMDMQGMAYTTDGYKVPLADEPYQYGVRGLANVSSTLTEAIGEPESINVFTVPIFAEDDKTVIGILFATYKTDTFKQLLNIDSFSGQGYSYIVLDDGSVITDSAKSPMYGTKNVFMTMSVYSKDNIPVIERIQEAMKNGASGYETFQSTSTRALYYSPLSASGMNQNWYLFTIVPAHVLSDKTQDLLFYQNILLLTIALIIIGMMMFFGFTFQRDQKLLWNMAYLDPLTGDYNTHALYEQLEARKIQWGYIIAIDINDFKLVNSVCGIDMGNMTIQAIWDVICANVGPREMAAHVAGDNFILYVQEVYTKKVIARIEKISAEIEALAEELGIISLSPYFGIYELSKEKDMNPEASYNCANQAKKLAKGNRVKNWAIYEEIDFDRVVEDRELMDAFQAGIDNREFEVWYQPKYDSAGGEMVGAEALVRWRREDGNLVPPGRFIPLLEGNGSIITLDEYVFRSVCEQQKRWMDEGKNILPVSVNISRASLYFENIVGRYTQIISTCGVPTDKVLLEITESAAVQNSRAKALVDQFREAGFCLCLDDFGTGYSSLAMLNVLHFDVLKLDKSLVDFIGDEEGEKLVVYTIHLAHSLGMRITAEGVEAEKQVKFLENLQCEEIQGYYFSRPLPLEDFQKLLSLQNT